MTAGTGPASAETLPPPADSAETPAPAKSTPGNSAEDQISLEGAGSPLIGSITFAQGATADMKPVGPGQAFEPGITEIHALFEYQNMDAEYIWERVLYLDNKEILRKAEPWGGDQNGTFDYYIYTGGAPLASGQWRVELFVEGELLSQGNFMVGNIPTPTPTPGPTSTPTTAPTASKPVVRSGGGGTHRLTYSKWDGVFHNVYIADTNGNNQRLIMKRGAGPSFSPNGKQLFFFGEQGVNQQYAPDGRLDCDFGTISGGVVALDIPPGSGDICQIHYGQWFCERKQVDVNSPPSDVCEYEGVHVFQNLDWKEGTARWASVAPDGSAVAYDAQPGGGYRIYFRGIFNLAQYRFEIIGEQAEWSPDSQKLVYRSGRNNQQGIWISNRDDTGHTAITNNGTDSFPAWSPDGRTIAFSREASGGNSEIYTMNVDGSNLQQLTNSPGHDILPTFTPTGGIIFRSDRKGSWGIWKMNGDGSGQTEIIANAGVGPDWAMSKMDVE
jgi:hypothetical protein